MTNTPHIVCFDGYNFIHRARSGFTKGDWSVVFNFFRSFRSEVEKHKATRVIFVTEGMPVRRIEASEGTYKANRQQVIEEGSKEHDELLSFLRQKDMIIRLLSERFPVSVMRHPDFEADDVIYNVIKRSSSAVPWTVISTDTDFIQMLDELKNVKLYNPVKKTYVESPEYDYLLWKALRGDPTDNIKGLPGIGDKTAEKLARDPKLFEEKITSDDEKRQLWESNREMIKFHEFTHEEANQVESNQPFERWDSVNAAFQSFGFKSMLNEKSWTKFTKTFDHLWGKK